MGKGVCTVCALLINLSGGGEHFLIIAHEFGHFIIAKKNGIWVQEFAVGMGP